MYIYYIINKVLYYINTVNSYIKIRELLNFWNFEMENLAFYVRVIYQFQIMSFI